MEIILNDTKTKELLTEVIIELLQQRREVLMEIILEALEEVGLAKAISEGRGNEFVKASLCTPGVQSEALSGTKRRFVLLNTTNRFNHETTREHFYESSTITPND